MRIGTLILIAALALVPAAARAVAPDTLATEGPGTLEFTPLPDEPVGADGAAARHDLRITLGPEQPQPTLGERLLTEPEAWRTRHRRGGFRLDPTLDYNRVDGVRLGVAGETQDPGSMLPRVGWRWDYALGRERAGYGVLLEQPLLPRARLGLGVSAVRRTDHGELQQVDDCENSLALLFARQDYRDYFEREGVGVHLAWRVPDVTTTSARLRHDTYRSLPRLAHVRSWFARDRALRDNPAVAEGEAHAVALRFERPARLDRRARAGLYHALEVERAGAGLGGDFTYTRWFADVRSVLRLTPGTTLVLRGVGGATTAGSLPPQERFTLGGVDGLRAHAAGRYRGEQLVLGQAECTVALPCPCPDTKRSGLHAIAFVDAGDAWTSPDRSWDPAERHIQVDGGAGLTTAEDNMRVYVARNLQQRRAAAVVSVRWQRPF